MRTKILQQRCKFQILIQINYMYNLKKQGFEPHSPKCMKSGEGVIV